MYFIRSSLFSGFFLRDDRLIYTNWTNYNKNNAGVLLLSTSISKNNLLQISYCFAKVHKLSSKFQTVVCSIHYFKTVGLSLHAGVST